MNPLVFPGSFLSTEEEFFPLENCYQDESGSVFSDCVGKKSFDLEEKTVSVQKRARNISMISPGNVVFGVVLLVKEHAVVVEILEAIDRRAPSKKIVFGSSSATLPVFAVSNSFLKHLSSFFKVGDVLKARVESVSPAGIELETKSFPEFGVILAYCTVCRQALQKNEDRLQCANCANIEFRKASTEYFQK